jgi:LAO/AO transport system kinase
MAFQSAEDIVNQMAAGNTAALAKAITFIESTSTKHQKKANEILDRCLPLSGNSIRIAITGVPGVGKSTFIDRFGHYLITEMGKKVAVLAVDPTSQQTRGSILGDKTRMARLSTNTNAFIRPSPSGDTLGGVAAQTRESILLCEAAGYDVILVETVGVGQSETMVHSMVDFFMLLLLPGAGDELQGIKRGIVEMADAVVINKCNTNKALAKEAVLHYKNALQLVHSSRENWKVSVTKSDAIDGVGIDDAWKTVIEFVESQQSENQFTATRKQQAKLWFDEQFKQRMLDRILSDDRLKDLANQLRREVGKAHLSPRSAADRLIDEFYS